MSQPATNCKSEGRDPAIIARVIAARDALRRSGGRLRRLMGDAETAFTDAYERRTSRLTFADAARHVKEAQLAHRAAFREYTVASLALLMERGEEPCA